MYETSHLIRARRIADAEPEPRPAGTVLNLETRKRWIPNELIENITFWLDGSVTVKLKGNPIAGIMPREVKFVGKDAQDIRAQVKRQSDQFTDLMDKQRFVGKQKRVGRRHLACFLKKR